MIIEEVRLQDFHPFLKWNSHIISLILFSTAIVREGNDLQHSQNTSVCSDEQMY